ncbi:NAD(P)/FAD-dependent oxidoreductase [Olleya namhaensis]|uniref:NAD(P)/FAD-dependent oxidoreductase n=1 Tax=Olleya namhaensis TaxID=1144750 RepID=UPI0024926975|nr:NAD(P)/FAD-dependent oxidoreductase [Olleya namhaensis]
MKQYDVIIIGGGAAGFFAAVNIGELHPNLKVAILERGKDVLGKVKVSGGGRCNVTHAEFIPQELTTYYPRGEKELLGPFHTFMTGDTMDWFESRGVPLKIEDDGRIFPTSNNSQTIIDCFLNEADKHNVDVLTNQSVISFEKINTQWSISTKTDQFLVNKLIVATGSNPKIWSFLQQLDHTIIKPVPSLFTFNINDQRIKDIPGVVAQNVTVKVVDSKLESSGPLLITHWGMSAPSILKLSAFGALELAKRDYKFDIEVNFINQEFETALSDLKDIKQDLSKKTVFKATQFDLPKRLWKTLVLAADITEDNRWADLNKIQLEALAGQLTKAVFKVDGKSTFKEEFVTAGGIDLKEVNFKNYQSKIHDNLYFAGEIINVDAVTGGFNFQNAWTSAYIVAKNIDN